MIGLQKKENRRNKKIEYLKVLSTGDRIRITEVESSWFIKWYEGKPIVTLQDFNKLTKLNFKGFYNEFEEYLIKPGRDWNVAYGEETIREFNRINKSSYKKSIKYMYLNSFLKALSELKLDRRISFDIYEEINSLVYLERKTTVKLQKKQKIKIYTCN